jgi:hypothetical protein
MVRQTRKRGQPSANPSVLHAGTVRRGANDNWWVQKHGEWNPIVRSTIKKRSKKASRRMIEWAEKHAMIKVFYNNPEACNCLKTKKSTCMRIPAPLEGWYMSRKLRPTFKEIPFSHVDEYIGPVETMQTMHRLMEAQFKTYKKLGLVTDYDLQVNTMIEKYEKYGRI